jgi:hypothetical protein
LHEHWPAVQPSPLLPHTVQLPPAVPHAVGDWDMHIPPEQQPLGHDAALQTHAPPTHSSPWPQAGPLPHVHPPVDEHPSAPGPHGVHPAPIGAQAGAVNGVQTDPVQHPVGQEVLLQFVHVPPLQIWFEHGLHRPPPDPHAPSWLPGSHEAPLQHPLHEL